MDEIVDVELVKVDVDVWALESLDVDDAVMGIVSPDVNVTLPLVKVASDVVTGIPIECVIKVKVIGGEGLTVLRFASCNV